ncbi:MAG TPA: hypothetical protein VNH80_05725 [Burkholderiales bacterium]|nr:hypothetical protein [Burkholderiales bacterium]HXJ08574.1 hypothetical protein [Burkholderiales bacterium]
MEIDAGGKFIRAQFEEDATIADWNEALELLVSLVQGSGIRETLVDIRRQRASAPIAELFTFGSKVPKDVRFAVLARENKDDSFVELVARNRGATARLFFGAEEEAINWLLRR